MRLTVAGRRTTPDQWTPSAEDVQEAEYVGTVTDLSGEDIEAWRTPGGCVILAGSKGSWNAFSPDGFTEYRELLDRAGMPGLEG